MKINPISYPGIFFREKKLDKRKSACYSNAIMKKNTYKNFFDWRWCRR